MKNVINNFKMLKYGLQLKQLLFCSVLFLGLGCLFEFVADEFGLSISGLYFGIAGSYAYQISFSPINSKWVKSSPVQRKLLTSTPVVVSLITSLAGYTIFVLLRVFITVGIRYKLYPGFFEGSDMRLYAGILSAAMILVMAYIYQAFCFRYYLASTAVFVVLVITWLYGSDKIMDGTVLVNRLIELETRIGSFGTHGLIIITGYLLIILSALLCYGVNLLLYKKPLSSVAFRTALKQAGK